MNDVFVYYIWSWQDIENIADWDQPILYSIASLRRWNKTVKVIVIDIGLGNINWDHWPTTLNFEILHNYCEKICNLNKNCDFTSLVLRKPICCHKLSNDLSYSRMIVCDADIIWLKNPLPLAGNPNFFCHNKENSGFFYFSKNNEGHLFLRRWSYQCRLCVENEKYRNEIHLWAKKLSHRNPEILLLEEDVMLYTQIKLSNNHLCKFTQDVLIAGNCKNIKPHKGVHFHSHLKVCKTAFIKQCKEVVNVLKEVLPAELFGFNLPMSKSCELIEIIKGNQI